MIEFVDFVLFLFSRLMLIKSENSVTLKQSDNSDFYYIESHCLQAMKFAIHHANGRFDWLISGHLSVNPS